MAALGECYASRKEQMKAQHDTCLYCAGMRIQGMRMHGMHLMRQCRIQPMNAHTTGHENARSAFNAASRIQATNAHECTECIWP